MKKRIQGFIAGALAASVVVCALPAVAKEAAEQITAVYRNIRLVVDGVEVQPKDANGEAVEPFIYNGTTYLPVRAVATAFDKDVAWDGEQGIVYLGGEVEKAAKELPMWNRPYLEVTDAHSVKTYEEKGDTFIRVDSNWSRVKDTADGRHRQVEHIKYPLNSLASKISGEFYMKGLDDSEAILRIYDSNGKEIYESPIIRTSTANIPFDIDVKNEISVTMEVEYLAYYSNSTSMYIKNPAVITTDY